MAALPLIVFDVNETLLDLETMEPVFRRIFNDTGAMRLWFANFIMYSAALTVAGQYVPFTDIGAAVMKMLADTKGIGITDGDKDELKEKFSTMPPHPEVPAALTKLRDAGFRLFTLTDNLLEVQTRQLTHGGIVDRFERRFSADGVKHHKPSRQAYAYVERELGASPSQFCLIACHTWDTLGAVAAGWEAALIRRPGNDVLGVGPQPHIVGDDLNDVADQLIKRHRARGLEKAMPQPETFDVLVLGSGQGGKHLAWHLAKSGKRVAVVERRWVGGSCPAVACLPSKNEIWSARVAHVVRDAARFGTIVNTVRTDMARVWRRKQDMVEHGIALHLAAYRESGAELIMASGRFVAPKTIEATLNEGGTRVLAGDQVVINIGTHAAIPDVPGLREAQPLTHIEALELDEMPSHLIVLGGGYTGIEMAQAFRRFGSQVTVVEPGPQIMGREDPDISEEVGRGLRAEGIDFVLNAQPLRVDGRSGTSVTVTVRTPTRERKIEGSHLLVAVGRVANTSDIGLDKAGVALDERGFVRVDDRLRTTAAGVWAIGECAGSPQFTHVSVDDFRIVRDNMAGGDRSTTDRLVPHVVFTDPPLARVGLSEGEARRQGIPVRVSRLPMQRVLRTEATDEAAGFMKVLVAADDDRILGFAMIGAEAGEVMAVIQTAMLAGLPYPKLRDAAIVHLTVAEGLGPLFEGVPG